MNIDPKQVTEDLTEFIHRKIHAAGRDSAVVGVSGGIDSAVTATLCCRALGWEYVMTVSMPSASTSIESGLDTERLLAILGTRHKELPIEGQIAAYFECVHSASRLRIANKCARERMSILYDMSDAFKGLVVGTSNRSELMLGYGTLHGDCACDINPLANLYKTQIRQLAEYLDVPESIRTKPPSADLWPGQTDEGEIGYSYEEMDPLLEAIDQGRTSLEEFDIKMVMDITKRIKANAFKSQLPRTP